MAISVIPAYRVVTHFARQAAKLNSADAVDVLDGKLREYVRSILTTLNPSMIDIGERAAVTQLGDPDVGSLLKGLEQLHAGAPRRIVEDAISSASRLLPRPDLNSRVFIFPGDGESRVLVGQMNGVLGFSLGAQAMMVFLWPVDGWREWLTYTVVHEYAHLVRNLLFPRGVSGGKLVYMKTQQPETLLDAMMAEGVADAFAMSICPDMRPRWTRALDADEQHRMWPRVRRRLGVGDITEIRRMLFGDNDRVPPWTGYTFGYRIVASYLESNPDTHPAQLVSLPGSAIIAQTCYASDA